METFSALPALWYLPIIDKRTVMPSFDVFFVVSLSKLVKKNRVFGDLTLMWRHSNYPEGFWQMILTIDTHYQGLTNALPPITLGNWKLERGNKISSARLSEC